MQCCSNFELALLAWTLPDQLVTKPQLILLLRYHHLSNTCLFHFRSTAYWQRSMRLNNLIWPPVLEWRAILPLNTSIKANLSLMRAMPGKKIRLLISLRYVVYFYVVYRYIMLLFQVFVWLQIVLYASDVAKINYVDKIYYNLLLYMFYTSASGANNVFCCTCLQITSILYICLCFT